MKSFPAEVGAYRIVRRLGVSDENEVFLAVAQGPFGFERTVVLKRQRIEHSFEPSLLAREAQVSARLQHPAIVRLYDFFAHDGHLVMVREFVEGATLEAVLVTLRSRGERLSDAAVYFVASRIFAALSCAHSARDPKTSEFAPVIHRDVAPCNVLVPWDGFVKLADFGFAKVLGRSGDTASGVLKGTYGYMAPEQVRAEPVTVRTDVYCAALLLREMLIGAKSFERGDVAELEYLQSMAEPHLSPLEFLRPEVSLQVATALRRALAPDVDARAMTAELMLHVLREHHDPEEGRASLVETLARLRSTLQLPRQTQSPTPPQGQLAAVIPSEETLPSPPRALATHRTDDPVMRELPPESVAAITRTPRLPVRLAPIVASLASVAAIVGVVAAAVLWLAHAPTGGSIGAATSALTPRTAMTTTKKKLPPKPKSTEKPESSTPSPSATASAPPSKTGVLSTPIAGKGHRVFLDGRYLCPSGDSIVIACGKHVVKVGSTGKPQTIFVPCGGEVQVEPRW